MHALVVSVVALPLYVVKALLSFLRRNFVDQTSY